MPRSQVLLVFFYSENDYSAKALRIRCASWCIFRSDSRMFPWACECACFSNLVYVLKIENTPRFITRIVYLTSSLRFSKISQITAHKRVESSGLSSLMRKYVVIHVWIGHKSTRGSLLLKIAGDKKTVGAAIKSARAGLNYFLPIYN